MNIKKILLGIAVLAMVLLGMVFYCISKEHPSESIIISEICSRNQRVIYDKTGEYVDYVELFNPTNYTIDISGYMISDKETNDLAQIIEDSCIESGEYKIIYIYNFGISDNETIILSDRDGNELDRVKVPVLAADSAYTLDLSGNKWRVMSATPARENVILKNSEIIISGDIEKPFFSVEPGFYDEAFYLEIDSSEGTEVYYTLDGTEPDLDSLLYNGPIYIEDVSYKENVYAAIDNISTRDDAYIPEHLIDKANVIRAIAVDNEKREKSSETIGSYFVGYSEKYGYNNLYTLSIVMDPEDLYDYEKGIYVTGKVCDDNWDEEAAGNSSSYKKTALANYKKEGKGWRRNANLEVYGKDRQLAYKQLIEFGIHGGWSVAHNQKSFNLYAMPEKDGNEYLCEGLLADKETTLMLRAGGYRDLFSTKFRDVLNHRLVENRDIGILRAIPCQVFLNGEYWGLYNLQERIDGSYIEEHYGIPKSNIVMLKNKKVVEGEDEDYQLYAEVVEFAEKNDLSVTENYEVMKNYIDIQSYIDYYCFTIYVANCDSVVNNYGLWRSKTVKDTGYCDGRWRWILYDTDDSAGMVKLDTMTQAHVNSFFDGYQSKSPMEDVLFTALFENEEFRKQFADTFIEMAETNFAPDRVSSMIDQLYMEYVEGTVLSHQRYVSKDYAEDQYWTDVYVVRDFFARRQDYILDYLYQTLALYN